jgi:hypothetical protein
MPCNFSINAFIVQNHVNVGFRIHLIDVYLCNELNPCRADSRIRSYLLIY